MAPPSLTCRWAQHKIRANARLFSTLRAHVEPHSAAVSTTVSVQQSDSGKLPDNVKVSTEKLRHLGPLCAVAAAVAGLVGLLPLAFGMPAVALPLFPLASGLFFLVMLGGPLLLLASGQRLVETRLSKRWFLVLFMVLLITVGLALSRKLPGHQFLLDWVAMSLALVLIAAALRHSWLWAVAGGVWTGVLLGLASLQTAVDYFSPSSHGTPAPWWPLWLLDSVLAFTTVVVAFIYRNEAH